MPKIDRQAARARFGSIYPAPHHVPCQGRGRWQLGDVAGLTQFGVNLMRLPPGVWSAQRHWHSAEDEFVMVLEGEVVLVTDDGEELLQAGECAGFPAGQPNGHHLQNRGERDAVVLEVGSRRPDADTCEFSDIDMAWPQGAAYFQHRDGEPYERERRR